LGVFRYTLVFKQPNGLAVCESQAASPFALP
jgi:hypothetical protein